MRATPATVTFTGITGHDRRNTQDAVSSGRYSISLARKGDTQAVVLSSDADAPLAIELRKHLMPMPDAQQLQSLLRALPQFMETVATPEEFPNLQEGLAITDVSLSIVFDAMVPSRGNLQGNKVRANGAILH